MKRRSVEGLIAVGELTGPGIETPIRLETAPGHKFPIPGLSQRRHLLPPEHPPDEGHASSCSTRRPSIAAITVTNLLQTNVSVRQLTPEELRARGITVDAPQLRRLRIHLLLHRRRRDRGDPVPGDHRPAHARGAPCTPELEYKLPPITQIAPPRWSPPEVIPFELGTGRRLPGAGTGPRARRPRRPSIPAALVIPNSLAVLHQFFAVTLMVTNGAPRERNVSLDAVTAQFKPPATLRTVKSTPAIRLRSARTDRRRGHRRDVPRRPGQGRGGMDAGRAAARHAHDRGGSARHLQVARPAGVPAQGNRAHVGDRARPALQHHLLASGHGPQRSSRTRRSPSSPT